jgi:hypothetical protein
MRDPGAVLPRARFECLEQATADPETADLRSNPHPLDLSRSVGVMFDSAAPDRLAVQVCDEELAGWGTDLVRPSRGADGRIEDAR